METAPTRCHLVQLWPLSASCGSHADYVAQILAAGMGEQVLYCSAMYQSSSVSREGNDPFKRNLPLSERGRGSACMFLRWEGNQFFNSCDCVSTM